MDHKRAPRGNQLQSKTRAIFPSGRGELHQAACQREAAVTLHHVMEESVEWMAPGDILLLDGAASLRALVDAIFFAILACPACGKLDLITQSQYSGTEPVICAHPNCSCHFRIGQRHTFTYVPVT